MICNQYIAGVHRAQFEDADDRETIKNVLADVLANALECADDPFASFELTLVIEHEGDSTRVTSPQVPEAVWVTEPRLVALYDEGDDD